MRNKKWINLIQLIMSTQETQQKATIPSTIAVEEMFNIAVIIQLNHKMGEKTGANRQ